MVDENWGLSADGVLEAAIGHRAENLPDGAGVELVHSTAVPAENVERVAARERGILELSRAELLGELTALRRTIAVAGTHGKTTTASMLVHALRRAGMEPGWLVGGAVGGGLPNAEWGPGEWLPGGGGGGGPPLARPGAGVRGGGGSR